MKKTLSFQDADTLITDDYSADALWNQKMDLSGVYRLRKDLEKKRAKTVGAQKFEESEIFNEDFSGTQNDFLIANMIRSTDLLIFKMNPDDTTLKTEWLSLPDRLKEVFEEIIYSLPLSGASQQDQDEDGCYTFCYSDDEVSLSIISVVINGKTALFYKNIEFTDSNAR